MQITFLFNLFLIVSAIHGFLFSLFLIKSKGYRKNGVIFLSLMILVIALNNLQSWLLVKDSIILSYIQIPWHFLIAPLFYTFILHYLNIKERFFNILKVAIPFFIISIIVQIIYFTFSKSLNSTVEYQYLYEKYTAIEEVVSFLTSLSIFFYCFYIIKHKSDLFKKILSFDSLKWLHNFIILAGISYVLWGFALSFKFYLNFENFIVFFYPLRVMTTILIYWLGYELIFILKQIKERKNIRNQKIILPRKPVIETNEKFKLIESYIVENNRFLDSQLSLDVLAEELQMSTSNLSKIINEYTSHNFNSIINNYRIEFSKKLLLDPSYLHYTITSIALEAGFNSKSTFYIAFKKHTGVTPTRFREDSKGSL